ncbi:hypothetical protein M5D96_003444 [Drosophila gunungcola]|uniref:Uncharacterized protein n=1 Tax=Drosophila gunungcola TaxID=103775 RepID=A0A9Q0BRQ1_9MUSC|nr:hypothetical protein M5D96_003444 [Drosophila gunungcola]
MKLCGQHAASSGSGRRRGGGGPKGAESAATASQPANQPASRDNSIEDSAHTPRSSQSPWGKWGMGIGKDASLGQSQISPCSLLLPVAFFGKRFISVASINKQTDVGKKQNKIRPGRTSHKELTGNMCLAFVFLAGCQFVQIYRGCRRHALGNETEKKIHNQRSLLTIATGSGQASCQGCQKCAWSLLVLLQKGHN